ncbi:MAG: SBBP repeat-containing protein [Flavipsychrobacter sp.]
MHFNGTKFYTLLLCGLAGPLLLLAKNPEKGNELAMTGKKPLVFIENKGQITNQHYNARNDIQYKLSGNGMDVFVGNGALHYQFNKVSFSKVNKTFNAKTYRVDVALVGANKNATATAADEQEYQESYRLARLGDKQLTVHSFKKITYKDVYPNIDWVLYVKNNSLEYDFVVKPGGDVKNIKLRYDGATKMLPANGGIAVVSPMGKVIEKKPYSYEAASGKMVASSFELNKNVLSFNTDEYNGTIVIDPQIEWSTYYGGTAGDQAFGSASDGNGNLYVTGATNSAANIATSGAHSTTLGGGGSDAFLAKFSSTGSLTWATYFGGSSSDQGEAIAIDPSGKIYVAGNTASSSGISTTGAYQTTFGGGSFFGGDAFLAKFNSGDTLLWSTYYGGMSNDYGYAVTCNANGDVYLAGNTNSTGLRVMYTTNGYDTSFNGTSDIFIAKFRSNGNRVWSTFYGGSSADQAQRLVTDKWGNVYATGYTYSNSGIATSGAYQTSVSGGSLPESAFLVKFDSTSHLKWGTYYGNNSSLGYGLLTDTLGNIYLSGYTSSTANIASAGSYQSTYAGANDLFLAKFDTSGARKWGTYYGGTAAEGTTGGLAFDNWGNVIMTGNTQSSTGIATSINGAAQSVLGGFKDACLVKFTPFGQLVWGSYFGNSGDDEATALSYDPSNGAMYMSGFTNSTSGIALGLSPYQSTFGGGTSGFLYGDAFIAKFNPDTMVFVRQRYTDTLLCPGGIWNVAYTTSYDFNSGNSFTVQLSDASGSFAAPVNIGTATATSSGTIAATVPALTPLGNGYRIRIVSTNPAFTSPDEYYNIHVVSGIPTPVANNNGPICVGDSLKLTSSNSANPPVTLYSWTGPGGYTANTQNPVIPITSMTNAGAYTVTTTRPGCPGTSANTTVVINNVFPNLPTDSVNSPICAGSTLYLFSNTTTPGATYSWRGPNGFASTLQNPTIPAATSLATGRYYVSAVFNTCKATDSLDAVVNIPGSASITVAGIPTDTFCVGQNANFTTTTAFGGTDPKYQWVVNHVTQIGAISNEWGSPYLSNGDTVYCILTSNADCISNPVDTSNYVLVTILPITPPTVTITASPSSVTTPGQTITYTATVTNGGTAPTYQWYKNGVLIPGATTNPYATNNVNNGDVMSCTVVSNAQCVSPNTATGSSARLGVEITEGASIASMYPNPNNGNFTVTANFNGAQPKEATIEVLNVVGQVVYTETVQVVNNSLKENIKLNSELPNGMYILKLTADENSSILHFSINR